MDHPQLYLVTLSLFSSLVCCCCRRWRHHGWWPRWGSSAESTDCLTRRASSHETWAAQDCNTDPDPIPVTHHHHHYLIHHPAHLHPAQSPSAPATASDFSTTSVQACSSTYTHGHIQPPYYPDSALNPHPDTHDDHTQLTPDSYCPCFRVTSLSDPSSQPRHPGRGAQTHCPPGSLHRRFCSVSPWPPAYRPHHSAPSGSPEPASTCSLSPAGCCRTANCSRPHHPHIKSHPPTGEWHNT